MSVKKVFTGLLICALVGGLGTLFFLHREEASRKSEELQNSKNEILQVNQEIRELENQLDQIEGQVTTAVAHPASIVLAFANATQKLYTEIYPSLSQSGYKGTIILEDGALPGDGQKLEAVDFNTMLENGWSCALSVDNSVDINADPEGWKAAIANYQNELQLRTGYTASTYYFHMDRYSTGLDPILAEAGFGIVVYEENPDQPIDLSQAGQAGISCIGMIPYRADNAQTWMEDMIKNQGCGGLLVYADWQAGAEPEAKYQYSTYGMSTLFESVAGDVTDGKVQFISSYSSKAILEGQSQNVSSVQGQYQDQINQLQQQIADLEKKKKQLYTS